MFKSLIRMALNLYWMFKSLIQIAVNVYLFVSWAYKVNYKATVY